MAKQLGRLFLIKIKNGSGGFDAFAGLTSKSLKINNERVDATTPDPTNPEGTMWRETLQMAKSVDVSGDFTLVGDAAEAKAIDISMADKPVEGFEVVVPGAGTFDGNFVVDLEFGDDGKLTGGLSLSSDGKITFTAAA